MNHLSIRPLQDRFYRQPLLLFLLRITTTAYLFVVNGPATVIYSKSIMLKGLYLNLHPTILTPAGQRRPCRDTCTCFYGDVTRGNASAEHGSADARYSAMSALVITIRTVISAYCSSGCKNRKRTSAHTSI